MDRETACQTVIEKYEKQWPIKQKDTVQ